ncbi:MAG: hypothetical protein H0U80_04805 [Solirubrobacterales bacterium]|nr:hypothetical protein [Solirubrobacterales bacterium]
MRVIECNQCGETISAADDDELTERLAGHLESEHDDEMETGRLADFVSANAYDATDS